MPKKIHNGPHKYQRIKLWGHHPVYKCMQTDCSHYIEPELVVNRLSICWECEDEFRMSAKMAKLVKPHCATCGKGEKKTSKRGIDAVLENLEK